MTLKLRESESICTGDNRSRLFFYPSGRENRPGFLDNYPLIISVLAVEVTPDKYYKLCYKSTRN